MGLDSFLALFNPPTELDLPPSDIWFLNAKNDETWWFNKRIWYDNWCLLPVHTAGIPSVELDRSETWRWSATGIERQITFGSSKCRLRWFFAYTRWCWFSFDRRGTTSTAAYTWFRNEWFSSITLKHPVHFVANINIFWKWGKIKSTNSCLPRNILIGERRSSLTSNRWTPTKRRLLHFGWRSTGIEQQIFCFKKKNSPIHTKWTIIK